MQVLLCAQCSPPSLILKSDTPRADGGLGVKLRMVLGLPGSPPEDHAIRCFRLGGAQARLQQVAALAVQF